MNNGSRNSFLWGAATSSYQIEGNIENDHSAWSRLGKLGNNGHNYSAGTAADHWQRWQSDFSLLPELGVNSYRFSLEWARIEPEPGVINQAALDQYSKMIDHLLSLNITPMITLHHFTHPHWFIEKTPWHRPSSVGQFMKYVELVTNRLLDRVPYVITINEPLVWLLAGYGDAKFPPAEKNLDHLMQALHNMLMAHREAYDYIKSKYPKTEIGIAHNFISFRVDRKGNVMDEAVKRKVHYFYNMMLPQAFKSNRLQFRFPFLIRYDSPISLDDKIDFWGINYYYRMRVRFRFNVRRPFDFFFKENPKKGVSDLGWEIYPRGLEKICKWLASTGKPLIITENGIAAVDDTQRVRYLQLHLGTVQKLITEGQPIIGYYHWSFLDNYEWLIGTSAKFGLVDVDFSNGLHRTMKPSGLFYKTHIQNQQLHSE